MLNIMLIEILEKNLLPDFNRKKEKGSVLERKLLPNMSEAIFQQDGAPAHHSHLAQNWLQSNLDCFWVKGTWPGNSPDLSPLKISGLSSRIKSMIWNLQPMKTP